MKRISFIGSIACGLLCVACVMMYVHALNEEAEKARVEAMDRYGGEQVSVVVATRDIYPGEYLDSNNTITQTWLRDLLPEKALTQLSDAEGKQLSSLVIKGEVLSEKRFSDKSHSLEVPEGLVALSVPAKDVQTVGGALQSGNTVDVFATGVSTVCLGEDVLVLATNASNDEMTSGESISWVTLAVKQEQAQEYITAAQSMELYFVLPSSEEKDSGISDTRNSSGESFISQIIEKGFQASVLKEESANE